MSTDVYQLQRLYVFGSRTFTRPIYKPVSGKVTVFRTRSGTTTTITPSIIDLTLGRVTVTGHVGGDTYSWTGEFDVPVAFTSDMMEAVIENKNGGGFPHHLAFSIQVEEIRL